MIPEIISEVQISYSSIIKARDRMKITGSTESYCAFKLFWPAYDHIEFMYMLMLNRQNQVLGYHQISKGGMTGTIIDIRVVFQVALKACATSILVAHNHPSGNLEVSSADRKITQNLKEAGLILEIPLLDHLILSSEGYYSMADEGIL